MNHCAMHQHSTTAIAALLSSCSADRSLRTLVLAMLLTPIPFIFGQTTFPDLRIYGVDWSTGDHPYQVPQHISSPGLPGETTTVRQEAQAEFRSAQSVHLTPGFHAGELLGAGQFHAHIAPADIPVEDLLIIAPDPTTHLIDGMLQVEQWEKLELGVRLPDAYRNAIASFFTNYYSNGVSALATPGAVDDVHDLNPYADDSLVLVMRLTSPSGVESMKWGFYMKEAWWTNPTITGRPSVQQAWQSPDAELIDHNVRFRTALNEIGTWHLRLHISAPHTLDPDGVQLPTLSLGSFPVVCMAPLPDNKGPLLVNPVNRRNLQFQDGSPFIALGTNLADKRSAVYDVDDYNSTTEQYHNFYRRHYDIFHETLKELHDAGANFARMWLYRGAFGMEWVNPGVYDAYRANEPCDSPTGMPTLYGNCQAQAWTFDKILDKAREENIYLQLGVDVNGPGVAYENYAWGPNPYVINYLEPRRDPDNNNRYDLKEYFYTTDENGVRQYDEGVFYYWKRKYKYLMARWGYSTQIAIWEPFNEVDQMLTYQDRDLSLSTDNTLCPENRMEWPIDTDLPATVSDWLTDITNFVRGPVDLSDPVHSPLGEDDKLFLVSFTDAVPPVDPDSGEPNLPPTTDHYLPMINPNVDLISSHQYFNAFYDPLNLAAPDDALSKSFDRVQQLYATLPSTDLSVPRKPVTQGEFGYLNELRIGSENYRVDHLFHNYDVTFHNELWSSVFSGKFSGGTSWLFERVFWWEKSLATPPPDQDNLYQQAGFSNVLNDTNTIDIGPGNNHFSKPIINSTVSHHFISLRSLLDHPAVNYFNFFGDANTPDKAWHQFGSDILECYFIKNSTNNAAIGWLHNGEAAPTRNYYVKRAYNNFLGCSTPSATELELDGFAPGQDYFIYWFPTRLNTTAADLPIDQEDLDGNGSVTLDLSSRPLGGVLNYHIDTLHADYAFIISPEPLVKRRGGILTEENTTKVPATWDFSLYPNPAHAEAWLHFDNDKPKDIQVLDATGRLLYITRSITAFSVVIDLRKLARGLVTVRVSEDNKVGYKKLLIQ